mmetsp:Transcript_1906/g.5438  ORF Transcript_1906/g.5438 Transcript_1906/m.5438 type:complete len:735 (+) Transcript_1906:1-2205(+)
MTDLRRALRSAHAVGQAASIREEAWDFADCNSYTCMKFLSSDSNGPPIKERIRGVLTEEGPWDFVITHNVQGEYSHLQHQGLHTAVKETLNELSATAAKEAGESGRPPPKRPQLLVFNPLPELLTNLSRAKASMGWSYFDPQSHFRVPRVLLFDSLMKYTEHIVPDEDFQRNQINMLSYFPGAQEPGGLHFQYLWSASRDLNYHWGEIGKFNAKTARVLADEFLWRTWKAGCGPGRRDVPWYPDVCVALYRHFQTPQGAEYLDTCLARMELRHMPREPDEYMIEEQAPEAPPPVPSVPAARQCVLPTAVGRFGGLQGWTVKGHASKPFWMELLFIRPISVGWKQGYKGRTYKVLGSSGPVLVDLSSGTAHVSSPAVLNVQPQDLFGWGLFDDPSAAGAADVEAGSDRARCLGAKGCDEAGLCVFDEPVKENTISSITAELGPRPPMPRRQPQAPYQVRPALDLTAYVEPTTSYEEFMSLRQKLKHPDLGHFEDKIRLRRELLPSIGAPATPSIHLSNTDFEVGRFLEGRRSFVVKPSHMSESQFVFVVRDGVNLLQQAWGHPDPRATTEEIERAVKTFRNSTALDWECRALVGLQPGVVVEELILGESPSGKLSVDEYKFYAVWGEVAIGESVPFSSGAVMEIARNGEILTTKMPCPPWCVSECYADMVTLAEKVARNARTDFLRVDILVKGRCEGLFVSEVELFPASDFSIELKRIIAARWRWGYGFVDQALL